MPLGKNSKLTPKWQGPAKVTEINYNNSSILLPNGKSKALNMMRLKRFFVSEAKTSLVDKNRDTLYSNSDHKPTGPSTRAMKKIMDYENAFQLAINILCDLTKEHCAMCKWEQDCSDNPLLLHPVYAHPYIKKEIKVCQQSINLCKVQIKTRQTFRSSSSTIKSNSKWH